MNIKQTLELMSFLEFNTGHKFYLVGSTVTKYIMGRLPEQIEDIDLVTIGWNNVEVLQTTLSMFFDVKEETGKNFGVTRCLVKDTEIEIVMARTESGSGTNTIVYTENITLESDLARRHFTIYSMAMDYQANIIDPYGGLDDLRNKILRPTSVQFPESIERILIGAVKKAELSNDYWKFDISFLKYAMEMWNKCGWLMTHDEAKELLALPKEQINSLIRKAMQYDFELFWETLYLTGWLDFFEEIEALVNFPQNEKYHKEGDVWTHTKMVMSEVKHNPDLQLLALLHDIGKPNSSQIFGSGEQPKQFFYDLRAGFDLISHKGHEKVSSEMAYDFLIKYGFSIKEAKWYSDIIYFHGIFMDGEVSKRKIRKIMFKLDESQFFHLLDLIQADNMGKFPHKNMSNILQKAKDTYNELYHTETFKPILMGRHLIEGGLAPGKYFGEILREAKEAQIEGEFTNIDGAKEWLDNYLGN